MATEKANEVEKDDEDKIEQYHVEDAFRHLMEAEKVKKNPKLLAKVKAHARLHGEAIHSIAELAETQAKSIKELRALANSGKDE